MMRAKFSLALTIGMALLAAGCDPDDEADKSKQDAAIELKIARALSQKAKQGQRNYKKWCASCHGRTAAGSKRGPSLIDYERSHHSDGFFFDAVRQGVKAHHWNFGDMPKVEELTDEEIAKVIVYVREIQALVDKEAER